MGVKIRDLWNVTHCHTTVTDLVPDDNHLESF